MPHAFWTALDRERAIAAHHGDNDRKHHTFDQPGEHIPKQQPAQGGINIGSRTDIVHQGPRRKPSQQASRILNEKGAKAVDFRLETKDGKVSLKARPVKS